MSTVFFTGLDPTVKPSIDGTRRENRYPLCNSSNRNRKVIRSGASVTTQFLGIDAPTVAPTGTAGTGNDLFYCYVYVSKSFTDPLALEPLDPYLRSNASPILTIASATTPATDIIATVSTDPQVTHLWLYVTDSSGGIFVRISDDPAVYEVANTGTPTWATGVSAVPTAGIQLVIDNSPPDTCSVVCESGNGFYCYGGFTSISNTGSIAIGGGTITFDSTIYDGVRDLFVQFTNDTTGGPTNNGVFILEYVNSTTANLVNPDGTADAYDGPSDKTSATCRIWRDASQIQISKKFNPDFTPGIVDPDFLFRGPGGVTGIAKPTSGYALRFHFNDFGKKSVSIADFTQGIPPRVFQTASPYSMSNARAYANAGARLFYYDVASGIIEDQGMNHKPVTINVIPNLIRSLNATSFSSAEMEFDEYRNLLFLTCAPSGYTRNHYFIVYNLTSNTWNLWFMLPDVLSMRKIYDSNGIPSIYCGSSQGSITVWPSAGFNEAVGSSINGVVASIDDSTHLTVSGNPFPTSGDKLKDRWVMTWNDADDIPTYQFARVSDNTSSRLTCDLFIGPNSSTGFSPIPQIGDAFWMGPIQAILGPNWDFNSVPDEDGQVMDIGIATSGMQANQVSKISLYRNLEATPSVGTTFAHNLYASGEVDTDHQSFKSGVARSIEATGITGWQLTDNNESALSLKTLVKRIRRITDQGGKHA
jgi:hypothetical protein